jgi:hypothetical protein
MRPRAHSRHSLPTHRGDEILARLKKLSDQLDTAKKSADLVAKEIQGARQTTDATKKAVRRNQPARDISKKRRLGKKR